MTIAAIDFNGVWWATYMAYGDAELNDARIKVVGQIRAIASDYDHTAICVDSPKSKRREAYAGYKAQRPPKEEQALEQMRRTLETLRTDGFCIIEVDGYEADDVMGSIAEQLRHLHAVDIVSADKDMMQCLRAVEPGLYEVRQVITGRKARTRTAEGMLDDLGLYPEQIPTWLALMGDTADNIPGVHKCGPKTAAKWLVEYKTLDRLMMAAQNAGSSLTDNQRKWLLEAASREECPLSLSLELATICTTLTIDVDAVEAARVPLDIEEEPVNDDIPDPEDDDDLWRCPACEVDRRVGHRKCCNEKCGGGWGTGCYCCHHQSFFKPGETIDAEPVSSKPAAVSMVVRDVSWEQQLEPQSQEQAWFLAKKALDSRLFSAYGTQAAIFTTILSGRSYGLDAMQSLRSVHIIEGKPTLSAQLLHALCLRHPDCEYFYKVESTAASATYETKRRGSPKPERETFTIEDAREAGLTNKNNWKKYPKAMLRNRCVADLARAVYPDATHNTYLPEELERS